MGQEEKERVIKSKRKSEEGGDLMCGTPTALRHANRAGK